MYAPTLDRPTTTWTDKDVDTEFLLIDEFDTWSIQDLAAWPSYQCYTPDPTTGTIADA